MPKTVRLRECSGFQCGDVDDAKPVIPRVKIIGWESRNRRQYLPESVDPKDYDDIQVNLNHPDGPNKQRLVQERFGWFEQIEKAADGLYGNLHYNPELPYAKAFAWWAKHKPNKIGMSHDAVGTGTTKDGVFIVEKVHPKSVDLVADPASTKGLFESMEPDLGKPPEEGEQVGELADHVANAVNALVKDDKLDLKVKLKKIKAALKLLEEPGEEDEEDVEEEEDDDEEDKGKVEESVKAALAIKDKTARTSALKQLRESLKAKKRPSGVKALREELDRVKTTLALRDRNELAHRLCEEAHLPAIAVSKQFLKQLLEAKDEKAMKELIADRKALASVQKPRSTGPIPEGKGADIDNKAFAKALRE